MSDRGLQRLMECSICLKEFTDPIILPCIHTFCLECLRKTVEAAKKEPGDGLPCPLCRREFSIPAEGVKGLQKNFFMQGLLDFSASLQSIGLPAIACAICKALYEGGENTKPATMLCVECTDNFCDACSKAHTLNRLCRSHHIMKIGSETEEDIRRMCSTRNCTKHHEKPLEYYCPQCKIIVCVSGVVESHATHKCKEVKIVENEFRQVIERNASKISIYANEVLPKCKIVDQRKDDILQNLAAIENEIIQRQVKMKEMIDDCTKALLEELSLLKQKHVKACETEKEEIEGNHIILKSFETYCTELRSKGSASDVCGCVDELTTRANELEKKHEEFIGRPLQSVDLSFIPTDLLEIENTSSRNVVGGIQETLTQMENCAVIAGLHDGRNSLKEVYRINLHRSQDISTLNQIPTKVQNGSSAAVYRNTMYVTGIGENSDEIWSYNSAYGWMKCAPLIQGRSKHCAEFIDGVLYICGGWCSSKGLILKSVEAYNTDTKGCKVVGRLVYFVESSGNCIPFRSSLYIFGGSDKNDKALNQVQMYDTKRNICTLLSKPMPRCSRLMRAVLWETSVILLGCDTCFIYNFGTEIWQERKQFKTDVVHFGLTLENERVFVIGGGMSKLDDAGKCSFKCRGDVRYAPLKNIIDDKPVKWKPYGKLGKPVLVHCSGKMLLLAEPMTNSVTQDLVFVPKSKERKAKPKRSDKVRSGKREQ